MTELGRANVTGVLQDHPDVASSMVNLSSTYTALKQYDKAIALKEEALAIR